MSTATIAGLGLRRPHPRTLVVCRFVMGMLWSPRRRGQRGARAAQRARTTLTLTSGEARSAARKVLAGQHAQHGAIGAQPNCLDPLRNRRKTGTNHSPAAPAQNLCLRRRRPSSTRSVTHIHAGRPRIPHPWLGQGSEQTSSASRLVSERLGAMRAALARRSSGNPQTGRYG